MLGWGKAWALPWIEGRRSFMQSSQMGNIACHTHVHDVLIKNMVKHVPGTRHTRGYRRPKSSEPTAPRTHSLLPAPLLSELSLNPRSWKNEPQ